MYERATHICQYMYIACVCVAYIWNWEYLYICTCTNDAVDQSRRPHIHTHTDTYGATLTWAVLCAMKRKKEQKIMKQRIEHPSSFVLTIIVIALASRSRETQRRRTANGWNAPAHITFIHIILLLLLLYCGVPFSSLLLLRPCECVHSHRSTYFLLAAWS